MRILQVGLDDRSYPIMIEPGCLDRVAADLADQYKASRYCIVSDDTVAALYGNDLLARIQDHGLRCDLLSFPHGEANKNLETVARLVSSSAQLGLDRKSMFIALGGGVTGDITGFLASAYMRGIPFIQIPTTLLAQVDSSVGGKTGVDIPEGKNLVGTFYQPQAVYIDTAVLRTLPEEQFLSGMAEVIKHGFILDNEYLKFLGTNQEKLMSLENDAVVEMIYTSCRIKAEVVSGDERESDSRRILNFGHTIGHAVEAASKFSISHGFAVAIGMVAISRIGVMKSLISAATARKYLELIKQYGLPTEIPEDLDRNEIKSYLNTDKKSVRGKISYVLPTEGGGFIFSEDVSEAEVDAVLNFKGQ
jgi:3-dehydroquinate synthase